MIGLVLLLQAVPLPTVGDTIWVTRTIRVASGDSVRPGDWTPGGALQLLGRPRVVVGRDSVEIRYPVVAWEPGIHQVDVPGPILVSPTGSEDTLASEAVTLAVGSVLPADVPDTSLRVQPPTSVVPRGVVSMLPVLLLTVTVTLLLLPLHWLWRRRGKPPVATLSTRERPAFEEICRRWSEAEEHRIVATLVAGRLRSAIARAVPEAPPALDTSACLGIVAGRKPGWPIAELTRVLGGLDAARFAPANRGERDGLYADALRLERLLGEGA